MKLPLFSIITVTYNASEQLQATIDSVVSQTHGSVEYIVVDGGSDDGTIEIIRNNEKKITTWVSERDDGIYAAMNKGLKLASGEWVNYMNAGDAFSHKAVLARIARELIPTADVVYGNRNYVKEHGDIIFQKARSIDTIYERMPFGHQSVFIRRSVLQEASFNETYKFAADYELLIRLYQRKAIFQYIDETICNFRAGGKSESGLRPYLEAIKVLLDSTSDKQIIRKNQYLISFQKECARLVQDVMS
jgi:glycosyltransferase involved in cell wall biosynthesis